MRDLTEANVTEAVLAQIRCDDQRLQELLVGLTKHLHDFVREVELTESEWMAAIQFLTAAGRISDDQRQEFILLSDVLGLSILVDAINNRKLAGTTESTVFGPFWVAGAPELPHGASIARGGEADSGETTVVHGTVTSAQGRPIEGAIVDVWQASPSGLYDVQDPGQPAMNLRGLFRSGPEGQYWFKTVKPAPYPIPDDGPAGDLLRATGRHPMRPAHIHFMVGAANHKTLITHIFVEGDPYLESDAVFGVKDSLVFEFVPNHSETEAARYGVRPPFIEINFDIVLESVEENALSR